MNGKNNQCALSKDAIVRDLENNLEAEKRARANYKELAGLLSDKEDGKRILEIARCEEKHIKIVKEMIDAVGEYYAVVESPFAKNNNQ